MDPDYDGDFDDLTGEEAKDEFLRRAAIEDVIRNFSGEKWTCLKYDDLKEAQRMLKVFQKNSDNYFPRIIDGIGTYVIYLDKRCLN